MADGTLPAIIASATRLKISDLLSSRPRTLRELSYLTGVSVQGVLKHLSKLKELGLIEERKVEVGGVRKVYSLRGFSVGDFSVGDLTVVKKSRVSPANVRSERPAEELEYLAEETMMLRRRIKDQTRRLGRIIEEMVENETRLKALIGSLPLSDEERLVIQTAFTEETLEDAAKAIGRNLGVREGRRSIDKALAKAKRVGKR